jgi:hypothetical protein
MEAEGSMVRRSARDGWVCFSGTKSSLVEPMMTCSVVDADTRERVERRRKERQWSFMVSDESQHHFISAVPTKFGNCHHPPTSGFLGHFLRYPHGILIQAPSLYDLFKEMPDSLPRATWMGAIDVLRVGGRENHNWQIKSSSPSRLLPFFLNFPILRVKGLVSRYVRFYSYPISDERTKNSCVEYDCVIALSAFTVLALMEECFFPKPKRVE